MGGVTVIEQIGDYRILRELGRGATATVYLAESPERAEPVAIKVVQFEGDDTQWTRRLRKLFATEGMVARKLDHPNIVKIHETHIDDRQAYVVMEYVRGQELSEFCRFDRLLPLHRVVAIIHKCCLALDHAFREGVIHRDIKPANILVDDQDHVKIMDFGLALNAGGKDAAESTFIMGVGSPAYMSPEQIKSYPLNQKTDLYSLGVVLFHLLTGRLPFRAANSAQLIYKIINADPPRPSLVNPNVPEQMDRIVAKALEKDLYSRYRNGAEFAKDLSAVRFQIVDDNWVPLDTSRLDVLRRLPFFRGFEEVELWEILRISNWREIAANALIMGEGDEETNFGVIVSGEVEVSIGGQSVCRLGPGEVVGEMAYLNAEMPCRSASVVTLGPLTWLEFNPAALALATDETRERLHKILVGTMASRLLTAYRRLAVHGERAHPSTSSAHLELKLEP